ncbi:MAG: amidohydrolase family protein, partial [Rhodanobacteraceae bacterium]|nr:amidohydrolase family protein [Rhodanobacteraceae bacterium]
GTTLHAARALGLQETHGGLTPGKRADFVCWEADSPAELVYWLGGNLAREVVAGGNIIHSRPEHH